MIPHFPPCPLATRVTLLTGCANNFAEVHEPTLPGKTAYCQRWNILFRNRSYEDNTLMGQRVEFLLDELQKTDWCWFMDADTLIMNHAIDIRTFMDAEADCMIGWDRNGINNGSALWRNTPRTVEFLKRVLARRGRDRWDQDAMNHVAVRMPELRFRRCSQRWFNSFLEVEYGRPDDPRYAYRQGDVVLHFPGMDNAKRVRLIAEWLPRVTGMVAARSVGQSRV